VRRVAADPVAEQYEAYPYPSRDPKDEAKRLVTGSPSHLAELIHFVRGGRFDPAAPFRALIAGGGTGDAAIMLAQQLADEGAAQAEVVYLDRSAAARAITEARAAARGLKNLRFVTGSLTALDALGLVRFDYVDCCGVLHHLDDPAAGLAALARALAPGGGMGLMVYAPLGRTGVYPLQRALRALDAGGSPQQKVARARRVWAALPPTNWLRRNPFITEHVTEGDAELYDLLLHARDRAFSVPEVTELVARAGLRLVAFVPPARYEPRHVLADPSLLRPVDGLDPLARAALAEDLAGNIRTHAFYVVAADNQVAPPAPDSPNLVPVVANADGAALARGLKPGGVLTASVDGLPFRLPVPRLGPAILGAIDGRRTLGEVHALLAARDPGLDQKRFMAEFRALWDSLHALGKLMLRRR